MGASHSTQSAVASHDVLLQRLGGPEAIPFDDGYWTQLLTLEQPLCASDPAAVQAALAPHCRQLMVHNPITHNFQHLVLHMLELVSAAHKGTPSLAVANALHLALLITKFMVETGSPSTLSVSFEVTPGLPPAVQGQQSLLPMLINRLVLLICNVQPSAPMAYLVLLEAVLLLLTCASTQLHVQQTSAPVGAHPLLEALMAQQQSAAALVTALLRLVVSQPPLPKEVVLYAPAPQRTSVMRLVRTAAATVFWIPLRTYQYIVRHSGSGSSSSADAAAQSPLRDVCLSLLLVLAHYPAHHAHLPNGVRDGLQALQDTSGQPDAEGGHSMASPALAARSSHPTASFARLYTFFAAGPHSEASTLLLYTLLHGSRSFAEYVLVRSDPEALLLPVLQGLYEADRSRANHLYMLQIIVLMLSQDTSFSHNVHKVALRGPIPWYRERVLTHISLGSLVYVVLLRTAHRNIGQMQDLLLPTNALAALANLAPQVTNLHSHASQRLVGLTCALAKRWMKLAQAAPADPLAANESEVQTLTVLGDFLRILLELTNCILSLHLLRNPELVYALLHKQEVFEALGAQGVGDTVDNLNVVIRFFNKELDSSRPDGEQGAGSNAAAAGTAHGGDAWSVKQVLERVTAISQKWRGDMLKHLPEMRFVYEEEAAPEEFFVPYCWSLAVEATGGRLLSWNLGAATLLTQLSGMELSGDGSSGALEPRWSEDASAHHGDANV